MNRRDTLVALSSAMTIASGLARAQPATPLVAGQLKITRVGSLPSIWGLDEYYTGTVRIDPLFAATSDTATSASSVTFDAMARTLWHTHPLGQTLIVTAGLGWMQQWGESVAEIRSGDVVWVPPNVKHWHGATDKTLMTHIAVQAHEHGRAGAWLEEVSDAQYRR